MLLQHRNTCTTHTYRGRSCMLKGGESWLLIFGGRIPSWVGFSVCQEGLCNLLLIKAPFEGITLLRDMADWKFVPHLCQVWDKGLFLLHRWSLSADLEIDVIGTRGSRTSIDSGWRSVERSWMTAVAIVAIHSELSSIITVWRCGHDGRLTSCFYPASVGGWSWRRHRPWPCLSLGMNSVVGNHCNYQWHLLFSCYHSAPIPPQTYISSYINS